MHTCAVVRLRELLPRSKFCHRSPMSPIKWSSPEKVRRDKSLLPNELFLDIFDRIVPGPQGFSEAECQIILRRLAFVCRFFFAECTRRVYTRITLVGNKNSLAKRQGHGEWFKQIKANNKLAKHFTRYVERCEMVQWQSRDSAEALGFPKMMSLLLNQRAQIIASFENLTALQLLNVPITSPLFVTIFSKETLQIVEIVGCVFTPPERSWNVSPFKARWSSLLIERCPGSHLYLAPLKKLAASSKLQSFKTDINVIACILSLPAVFNGLQELNVPSSANVVELLNRTPTITKLGVTGDCLLEISSLLKTSVPHLTALTCSINNPLLLELSGRPKLRTIRLEYAVSSPQTVKRAWEALKRAKSLQSVSTTSGAYCCFSLHESLHTVDELRLFCEPPPPGRGHILLSDWIVARIAEVCSRWPVHSEVQRLNFEVPGTWLNLQDQHSVLVESISKAFPTAKNVVFAQNFEWTLQGSSWCVEVMDWHAVKELVHVHAQQARSDDVEDFQNALVKLFDKKDLKSIPIRSLLKLD